MEDSVRRRSSVFKKHSSPVLTRRNSQAISTLHSGDHSVEGRTSPSSPHKKTNFFGAPSSLPLLLTARDEKRKSVLKPAGGARPLDSARSKGSRTEASPVFDHNEKFKPELPKPNYSYQYNCKGVVKAEGSSLSGHRVEWRTSFDRPLEEMIYPSLQRYDFIPEDNNSGNLQRAGTSTGKEREKPTNGTKAATTIRPRTTQPKLFQGTNEKEKKDDDAVNIGDVSESNAFEEIVPKWSVRISQEPVVLTRKARDVFDEISEKGEAFLRKELVHKIRLKEKEKRERESDPFFALKVGGRGKERRRSFQAHGNLHGDGVIQQEAAMELYEHLLQPQETRKIGSDGVFVTETAMEGIYDKQKATLEKLASPHNSYLTDGIMYYRLRGEINRNEISEKLNSHNRASLVAKPAKERMSSFMREVDKRSSRAGTPMTSLEQQAFINRSRAPSRVGTAPVPAFASDSGFDGDEVSATAASKLAESLTSVRNALNSRYSGYDHREVEGDHRSEIKATNFMEKVRQLRTAAYIAAAASKPGSSQVGRKKDGMMSELSLLAHDLHKATGLSLGDMTQFDALSNNSGSRQQTPSAKSSQRKLVPVSPQVSQRKPPPFTSPTAAALYNARKQDEFEDPFDEDAMYENKRRTAQDMLLIAQLESGLIPEPFLKKNLNPKYVAVDLSSYGIGDVHGLCLAESIRKLDSLGTLGLSNNRLSSKSIRSILDNVPSQSLLHLDLSQNNLRGDGAAALALFFSEKVSLVYLDVSKCNMTAADVGSIFRSLSLTENCLQDLNISKNKLDLSAVKNVAEFILNAHCKLVSLDISWNEVGVEGAFQLCEPLASNWTITKLDLSACSLGDSGCQHIAAAVGVNQTLKELNLSHNSMMSSSCFVFAKELSNHRSLKVLDLSTNPLGEAGGRAIFRAILAGLDCFVVMRDCSFNTEEGIFNYSYPATDSPYELDLSIPYQSAVVYELMSMLASDKANFTLETIQYKETAKGQYTSISIAASNGEMVIKGSTLKWTPPRAGFLKIVIAHASIVPTLEKAISTKGLAVLENFIIKSKPTDRLAWLQLLCEDVFLTTAQAQGMIDRFSASRVIGVGGITTVDAIGSVWASILDTENKYDFLCANVTPHERRDLVYSLTFEQFKFNWINPTSHWRIDLSNKAQRAVMLNLIAINMVESEFSKNQSRRGDTSQKGNWFNFRNEVLNSRQNEITFSKEFFDNLPLKGVLEFDYVSTTRPKKNPGTGTRASTLSEPNSRVTSAHSTRDFEAAGETELSRATSTDSQGLRSSRPATALNLAESLSGQSTPKPDTGVQNEDESRQTLAEKPLADQMSLLMVTAEKVSKSVTYAVADSNSNDFEISDDDFYRLLDKLGLLASHKQDKSSALYSLMELQLASTKYYFSTTKALQIIDSFNQEDPLMPAKVAICIFSRIRDLHNFDIIMRNLDRRCQDEVILRLGWLNIANPLKPAFDKYVINLKPRDNRFFTIALLEIAAQESSDQLREDPNTEVSIVNLYGSFFRLQNDPRPETLKFNYGEVGERTLNVSWNLRRDALKKFLVGTYPMDRATYNVITWYKEMEEAGTLTVGPLDLQYANHLKVVKAQKRGGPSSKGAPSSRPGGKNRRSFFADGETANASASAGNSTQPNTNRRSSVSNNN